MEPEELAASSWLKAIKGRIVRSGACTCDTGRELDYAVVSENLRHAVVSASVVTDLPIKTHRGFELV